MANWVRMMGVTAASGPSFSAPLATAANTTRALPTRTGALCQAVGTRTGMPEPPRGGASPYSACGGGPRSGAGLGGLVAPRSVPPSQWPAAIPRYQRHFFTTLGLTGDLFAGWDPGLVAPFLSELYIELHQPQDVGPPAPEEDQAFAAGETCELDDSQNPDKGNPFAASARSGGPDPGIEAEAKGLPGNCTELPGTCDLNPV